jgi:hypothetical protein
MDFDTTMAEAAPARREPLNGPDSPAARSLYQQITTAPPAKGAASRRRRLMVLPVTGVAAALAAGAMALMLISGPPVTAARGQGGGRHATLAAWTAATQRDGLIKVTIRELRDPQGLARVLRADGVPVSVRFIPHPFTGGTDNEQMPSTCHPPQMSDKANAHLQAKIMPYVPPRADKNGNPGLALHIRPSAIPQGIGLSIAAWVAAPGTRNGAYLDLQADLVRASPRCTGS